MYFHVCHCLCVCVCISQLIQESLASKVNVDDLTSLMPRDTGADETSSLMSKLLEIQNRLSQLEGEFQEHSQLSDLGLHVCWNFLVLNVNHMLLKCLILLMWSV